MGKYWDELDSSVIKQIDDYTRGKFELNEYEIQETMPKVVNFYNNHVEGTDVFRDKNGCILLVQTPAMIYEKDNNGKQKKDKNGKAILRNGLRKFDGRGGGEDSYLLSNCKFRFEGVVESIGLFATKDIWSQMGGVYNENGFIKCSSLRKAYKQIGSDDKSVPLATFLLKFKIDDINELDEEGNLVIDDSDYIIYYSATITQVIKD